MVGWVRVCVPMDDKKKQSLIIKKLELERLLRLGNIKSSRGRFAEYKIYFLQDSIVNREYSFNPRCRRIQHFFFTLAEGADYFENNDDALRFYRCYTVYATSANTAGEFSFTNITNAHSQKNQEFLPKICSSGCCVWVNDCMEERISYHKCRSYPQYVRNVLFSNYLYMIKKYNAIHLFLELSEIRCSYINLNKRCLTNRQTVDLHNCLLNQVEIFKRSNFSKVMILKTQPRKG